MVRFHIPGRAEKQTCCAAVDQAVVNFIRDHDQVVFFGQAGDLQQRSRLATAPVGLLGKPSRIALVRGVIAAATSCGSTSKLFSIRQGISTGTPPARYDFRLVSHKTGGGDDHLIAGVEQGGRRQVERF